MNELMRLTDDIRAAHIVAKETGDLVPALHNTLQGWFSDVPLPDMPVPVMELDDDERRHLTVTVLGEMLDACVAADGLDDETAFGQLQPVLDPLWKELVGLRAHVFNAAIARMQQEILQLQEFSGHSPVEMAEQLLAMNIDQAVEQSIRDPRVRLVLRTLGLIS